MFLCLFQNCSRAKNYNVPRVTTEANTIPIFQLNFRNFFLLEKNMKKQKISYRIFPGVQNETLSSCVTWKKKRYDTKCKAISRGPKGFFQEKTYTS